MFSSDRKNVRAKIQAPFVLAEIRALRSSIFKKTQEVQTALADFFYANLKRRPMIFAFVNEL